MRKLLLALLAASVALAAANALDIRFETFEDGSGKVSWCLPAPLGDCSQ